jgi:hypothetical protein
MEYRPARTHRRLCLKALPRHDDVRRLGQHRPRRLGPHHPPSSRRRDQLHRHRRRLLSRRVRADRRQGAERAPRRRRARHEGQRADGRRPPPPWQLAAGSSPRSRTRCGAWAPTGSISTKSTAPIRTPISRRHLGREADYSVVLCVIDPRGWRPGEPCRLELRSLFTMSQIRQGRSPIRTGQRTLELPGAELKRGTRAADQ